MYLNSLWFLIVIIIYTVGLYIFGGYIKMIEVLDIFNCFISKELNKLDTVYDYVVVGCGSAGSVAALRLTKNKNTTVLVLEAGPYGSSFFNIPALGPILHLSSVDWQYRTVPQKNAAKAFSQQTSNWPMGRIIGGTGRLNNMIYLRGHPADYYDWFKENKDFNYVTDILEYFKKSENQRGAYRNDTKYHSSDGPLVVEDLSFTSDLTSAMLEAAKILKYPVRDLNGESNTGFMQAQVNINLGNRWTPASYLNQQQSSNLVLQTNTIVTKVLLKANYEAYAVKYLHLGQTSIVHARKGIILSAGVIGTPKLLMLSGIGPKEHLDEIGIKSKINLPVGNNLQDHITTGLDLITLNTSLGIDFKSMLSPTTILKYFYNSSGPWTSPGCEIVGLINTDSQTYHDSLNRSRQPDLQFMILPLGVSTDGGSHFRKAIGISTDTWKAYFESLVGHTVISILPIVLHPKSRGIVRLADKSIFSKPIIDPNYLSNPYDVKILLSGISLIKKLINTKPLQQLGAKLNEQKFPGCEHYVFDTTPYWVCYVRHLTVTSFHPAGTCKMGSINDPTSVVGYNFRVHHTNKLFIADASVMPTLPSGNINAATVMIAEKAAADIEKEYFLNTQKCDRQETFVQMKICKFC